MSGAERAARRHLQVALRGRRELVERVAGGEQPGRRRAPGGGRPATGPRAAGVVGDDRDRRRARAPRGSRHDPGHTRQGEVGSSRSGRVGAEGQIADEAAMPVGERAVDRPPQVAVDAAPWTNTIGGPLPTRGRRSAAGTSRPSLGVAGCGGLGWAIGSPQCAQPVSVASSWSQGAWRISNEGPAGSAVGLAPLRSDRSTGRSSPWPVSAYGPRGPAACSRTPASTSLWRRRLRMLVATPRLRWNSSKRVRP